ncbi:MAG: radical SAM protein [Theionarchaea archaeon]|nr:radical SAM protein [Theionarchaea archaeon]
MRGIFWEVTSRCNLRCMHCYLHEELTSLSTDPYELDTLECKRLIDQFEEAGVFYVTVLGGEPFCRPDFITILQYLGEKKFWTSLDTNGTLLDKMAAETLGAITIKNLNVSMEGPRPEIHDAIRGAGAYEKTIRGIENLTECEVRFRIGMIVNKMNYPHVEEMAEFCLDIGAQDAGFSLYVDSPSNRFSSMLRMNRREIFAAARKITEVKERFPKGFIKSDIDGNLAFLSANPEEYTRSKNLIPCGLGKTQATILNNGDIIPCTYMRTIVVGNVREIHVSEIAQTPQMRKMRELGTLAADTAIEQCRSCRWKYFCGGGCRARSYLEYGDLVSPDPLKCLLAGVDACE